MASLVTGAGLILLATMCTGCVVAVYMCYRRRNKVSIDNTRYYSKLTEVQVIYQGVMVETVIHDFEFCGYK